MSRETANNQTSRPRRFSDDLLLCLATIFVMTAGAELTARVFYHPPNLGTVIRFDRDLGWSLEPKARLKSVDHQRGLNYKIAVNKLGMRERELKRDKKTGTRRILFIGDSVTFGTGVDARWRFSDFISRALQDDTEVINAGVPGYGNDQELIYFEELTGVLHPDVVVLTLTIANDVVNNALDHLFLADAPKPHFVLNGDSLTLVDNVRKRPAPRRNFKTELKRSRFLLFVKRRMDRLRHRPVAEPFHAIPQGFDHRTTGCGYSHWSVFEKTYQPELESAWKVTEAILCRFEQLCRENHIELIVFAFPLKMEVDESWRAHVLDYVHLEPAMLDFEKPYRRLAVFCEKHSLEFYYPLEEFQDAFRRRDLYFEKDGHPNEYGHALAAKALLNRLREKHGLEFEIAVSDMAYLN